jgi:putative transposase
MHLAGADISGWVILPNHYHILVSVSSLDLISGALKQLHGATSRQWNLEDNLTGQRRVWYKFEDRMIRNARHFNRALNYIHYNPVKHRYVSDPFDWPWSSVFIYKETYGPQWLREHWTAYPPRHFGEGWDD